MDSVQFLKNSRPLELDSGKYVKVLFDGLRKCLRQGGWRGTGKREAVGLSLWETQLWWEMDLFSSPERIPFINLLLAGPRSEKVSD